MSTNLADAPGCLVQNSCTESEFGQGLKLRFSIVNQSAFACAQAKELLIALCVAEDGCMDAVVFAGGHLCACKMKLRVELCVCLGNVSTVLVHPRQTFQGCHGMHLTKGLSGSTVRMVDFDM